MLIKQISISNYKSLREVTITPGQLCVIVGANASGKSNFADCVDFISEVYRHGLEMAIKRKGGYDKIAFRRQSRSKVPIKIQLTAHITMADLPRYGASNPILRNANTSSEFTIDHSFAFSVRGSSIDAPYEVIDEELTIKEVGLEDLKVIGSMRRAGNRVLEVISPVTQAPTDRPQSQVSRLRQRSLFNFAELDRMQSYLFKTNIPSRELFLPSGAFLVPGLSEVVRVLRSMRVFQINPGKSREAGVPTPGSELERLGGNLPAVVDVVRKNRPEQWELVMQAMKGILPDLTSIGIQYTPTRQLSLSFMEAGSGPQWSVEDVSDGTVQTLALLLAVSDPSSKLIVLEEPENSVHPWIIRRIVELCREASNGKQIILTTHSPVVINAVRPEEVWLIWRAGGESHMKELTSLDPEFLPMWEAGSIPTFEYLDSGVLLEAVPPMLEPPTNAEQQVMERYARLHTFILSLGDDVQVKELKHYTAFKRIKNFACVEVLTRPGNIRVYVKIDPDSVPLEPSFTRDVRNIGHWGTGDLEILIQSDEDLERAQPLIRDSYKNDLSFSLSSSETDRTL